MFFFWDTPPVKKGGESIFEGFFLILTKNNFRKKIWATKGGNDEKKLEKLHMFFLGHAPCKKRVGNPFLKEFFDFDKKN